MSPARSAISVQALEIGTPLITAILFALLDAGEVIIDFIRIGQIVSEEQTHGVTRQKPDVTSSGCHIDRNEFVFDERNVLEPQSSINLRPLCRIFTVLIRNDFSVESAINQRIQSEHTALDAQNVQSATNGVESCQRIRSKAASLTFMTIPSVTLTYSTMQTMRNLNSV